MPLPTALTRDELQAIENELSKMWERTAELVRELSEHGEFELMGKIKTASGAVWRARMLAQERRRTAAARVLTTTSAESARGYENE